MPNPFAGHNEALATATTRLCIPDARTLIDWVDHAPGAAQTQASMWQAHAQAIEHQIPLAAEFVAALRDFATAQAQQAERIREAGQIFRTAHAAQLRRITEPRPGEDKWDISNNPAAPPAASGPDGYETPRAEEPLPEPPEGFATVQDVFDYGYCNALALALHERTGWPIVGLHARKDPHAFHYLVRRPDGMLVDAHGARTQAEVLKQWGDGAPEGYYSVRDHTQDRLWADVRQGDMENPAAVWPLAQALASRLAQAPHHAAGGSATGSATGMAGAVAAAASLAGAYQRGHTVEGRFAGGQNSELVQRVRLSDGTVAVYKRVDLEASENPDEVQDAYLAGLVAGALGIDNTTTAIVGDNEIISALAPGITGHEQLGRVAAAAVDAVPHDPTMDPVSRIVVERDATRAATDRERRRILHLRNGREIGLLDCLTGQLDRNDGNVMVDDDAVYPIDESFAYFTALDSDPARIVLYSAFTQRHLHRTGAVHDTNRLPPPVPVAELVSPFSRAELAEIRPRLQALLPEFEAHRARGKWEFMMTRLALIEAVAT